MSNNDVCVLSYITCRPYDLCLISTLILELSLVPVCRHIDEVYSRKYYRFRNIHGSTHLVFAPTLNGKGKRDT